MRLNCLRIELFVQNWMRAGLGGKIEDAAFAFLTIPLKGDIKKAEDSAQPLVSL